MPYFDFGTSRETLVNLRDRLQQLHRITVPPPDIHSEPTPATTVAFDTQQELLWVGNEYVSGLFGDKTGMSLIAGWSRDASLPSTAWSCEGTHRTGLIHRILGAKVKSSRCSSMSVV